MKFQEFFKQLDTICLDDELIIQNYNIEYDEENEEYIVTGSQLFDLDWDINIINGKRTIVLKPGNMLE